MRSEERQPARKLNSIKKTVMTNRDEFALSWIGHQYGIRLDQLQKLLGRYPGRGAAHADWISEGAARDVATRWARAGWVQTERIRAKEPFWIWLTKKGLRKIGLTYTYCNLETSALRDLSHLYAINDVRLQEGDLEAGTRWISERQLLQGMTRLPGKDLLHRPDGIFSEGSDVFAIEVELSTKTTSMLSETLLELVRGPEYLSLKEDVGAQQAQILSQGVASLYTEICYYAPKRVRAKIRRVRATLVREGILSEEESERICIYWYPLTQNDQEKEQEEREDASDE
jgi:hypothetical protein